MKFACVSWATSVYERMRNGYTVTPLGRPRKSKKIKFHKVATQNNARNLRMSLECLTSTRNIKRSQEYGCRKNSQRNYTNAAFAGVILTLVRSFHCSHEAW